MSNATSLDEFKVQVEQVRAGRKRVTWPTAIRERAAQLMAAGVKTTAIQNATKISFSCLHAWRNESNFKELNIAEEPNHTLTLRLSRGSLDVEIENLSTSAVVDILKGIF